jgi:hypothetical protein
MASPAGTASGTVGGKSGPGITSTAIALPNITRFDLDIARGVLTIYYGANQIGYYDYTQTTVVTDTISGTTSTFVVS